LTREKINDKKITRLLTFVAFATIILAWLAGLFKAKSDLIPAFKKIIPEAEFFEPLNISSYKVWLKKSEGKFLGFIAIGKSPGYGGTMKVAVVIDSTGTVKGISILEHKETFSFFRRVMKSDLLKSLIGKTYKDGFVLGGDVSGVTGATYTSQALISGVKQAIREIAVKQLKFPIPSESPSRIKFGYREIVLILLYATGFIGIKYHFKYKKILRWGSMLTGLLFLGFIYDSPLTMAFINKLLLGFLPDWRTHLYWYLLVGGILFIFLLSSRNPYCEWFCPFGAAQECFGVIGGARAFKVSKYNYILRWIQKWLAWIVIIIALFLRNPGISSYEIFGTFFALVGSNYQFILLGIVLTLALFIKRPWCNYLCPIRPVIDFLKLIRNWVRGLWLNFRPE